MRRNGCSKSPLAAAIILDTKVLFEKSKYNELYNEK